MLEAQDLVSGRDGRPVHPPVSFFLEPGDALVLRGANGAGKSTLLRTLAGFSRPLSGSLRFAAEPVHAALDHWQERLHWVGHGNGLKPALTLRENLAFLARYLGAGKPRPPGFGLAPLLDDPVQRLSQGQRRRAALARLVAAERLVWLLDEPAAGLDRANLLRLQEAVGAHRETGGIVVLASHGDVVVEDPLVLDL